MGAKTTQLEKIINKEKKKICFLEEMSFSDEQKFVELINKTNDYVELNDKLCKGKLKMNQLDSLINKEKEKILSLERKSFYDGLKICELEKKTEKYIKTDTIMTKINEKYNQLESCMNKEKEKNCLLEKRLIFDEKKFIKLKKVTEKGIEYGKC